MAERDMMDIDVNDEQLITLIKDVANELLACRLMDGNTCRQFSNKLSHISKILNYRNRGLYRQLGIRNIEDDDDMGKQKELIIKDLIDALNLIRDSKPRSDILQEILYAMHRLQMICAYLDLGNMMEI